MKNFCNILETVMLPPINGTLAQSGEHCTVHAEVIGSKPICVANIWPGRLVARIPPFQGEEAGSKPVRATTYSNTLPDRSTGRSPNSDSEGSSFEP